MTSELLLARVLDLVDKLDSTLEAGYFASAIELEPTFDYSGEEWGQELHELTDQIKAHLEGVDKDSNT